MRITGKLKRYTKRMVRKQRRCRIEIDIPAQELTGGDINEEEMSKWLDKRVGERIDIEIKSIEDTLEVE